MIGVVGHRLLADEDRLLAGIDEVVGRLEATWPGPWRVRSSLAEGADRLVVRRLLERPGTSLVAVLPLPVDSYRTDFATRASRTEFDGLLGRAHEIDEGPEQPVRDRAYEAAGLAVLTGAQVLIALWDGAVARGRGGTAHLVALARERGLPLAWVRAGNRAPGSDEPTSLGADQGRVTFERFP